MTNEYRNDIYYSRIVVKTDSKLRLNIKRDNGEVLYGKDLGFYHTEKLIIDGLEYL